MNEPVVEYEYSKNNCKLRLPLHPVPVKDPKDDIVAWNGRRVENIRNCDIFVEDHNFLMYADVQLFRFHTERPFDITNIKNLVIKFNTKERCFEIILPCLSQTESNAEGDKSSSVSAESECNISKKNSPNDSGGMNFWILKRITDQCRLQLDDRAVTLKFESNFYYGFASKFKGRIYSGECDLSSILRIPEPHLRSPLQRAIDREIDELKNFSREQYKLNFIELQVPEGHEDPMKFSIDFNECELTIEEECLLHNLTYKPEHLQMPTAYNHIEVDCGLISILFAICYDVRSTANEPTCESAWTRSILSAMLTYFEPFDNLKDVVNSFLRRSLIYPLYRNYEFGIRCVQDTIDALQKNRPWILKQILVTHALFANGDCNREIFNRFYLEDYIRYFYNDPHCSEDNLDMLARNLKNTLACINKENIGLGLSEIETELLKEIITDMNDASSNSDDDDDDDEEEEDDDDEESDDASGASEEADADAEEDADADADSKGVGDENAAGDAVEKDAKCECEKMDSSSASETDANVIERRTKDLQI